MSSLVEEITRADPESGTLSPYAILPPLALCDGLALGQDGPSMLAAAADFVADDSESSPESETQFPGPSSRSREDGSPDTYSANMLLGLALLVTFVFQYVMLPLGIWRLDSFKRPTDHLANLVDAVRRGASDRLVALNADVHAAWGIYVRSVTKDLQASTGVAKVVLTLSFGLLSIPSIGPASGSLALTFAWFSMIASATSLIMKFNMERHLINIVQSDDAPFDWIDLTDRYKNSSFNTLPMLLAGPAAWSVWAAVSFVALLLDYLWSLRNYAIHNNTMKANLTLPMLNLSTVTLGDPVIASTALPDQTGDSTAYFTLASIICLMVVTMAAIAHLTLNAFYFTRMGYPLISADIEMTVSPSLQPNADMSQNNGDSFLPRDNPILPPPSESGPVTPVTLAILYESVTPRSLEGGTCRATADGVNSRMTGTQ